MDALSAEEVRVLACLVEKAATVPDTYPLTLNALRSACNQSSSRDPVTSYDELSVQRALDSLKAQGLVRFVHAGHGARTTRFRHIVDESLRLDVAELALLSVLCLRGAQTAAELRSRAERQHPFAGPDEAEGALRGLAARPEPLVVELPAAPGRPQRRWAQLLGGAVDVEALARRAAASAGDGEGSGTGRVDRVGQLEAEVAVLARRLARLEDALGVAEPPDLPA